MRVNRLKDEDVLEEEIKLIPRSSSLMLDKDKIDELDSDDEFFGRMNHKDQHEEKGSDGSVFSEKGEKVESLGMIAQRQKLLAMAKKQESSQVRRQSQSAHKRKSIFKKPSA